MKWDKLRQSKRAIGKAERIAQEIEIQIKGGKLKEGEKLPSERELRLEYNTSRETVRRALEILEGERLVATYRKYGTFVNRMRDPDIAVELRRAGSFLKDMEESGHKPEVVFLEQPALVATNAEVAEHLQLPLNTLVLKRYRLQVADGLPYRLIESYYPADLFREVLTNNIGDTPLFDWLQEHQGLTVVHAKEDLIMRLATPDERYHLQISHNAPVVAIRRTVWANTRRVVEWARITAVAALYIFSYEYDIPPRRHVSRT